MDEYRERYYNSKNDHGSLQIMKPAPTSLRILTIAGNYHVRNLTVYRFERDDRQTANKSQDTLQSPRRIQGGQAQT